MDCPVSVVNPGCVLISNLSCNLSVKFV